MKRSLVENNICRIRIDCEPSEANWAENGHRIEPSSRKFEGLISGLRPRQNVWKDDRERLSISINCRLKYILHSNLEYAAFDFGRSFTHVQVDWHWRTIFPFVFFNCFICWIFATWRQMFALGTRSRVAQTAYFQQLDLFVECLQPGDKYLL